MKFDPMPCRFWEMLYCIPWTSETTAMTEATPIMMPSTVRIERSLLPQMARRAIFMFSRSMRDES